MRLCFCSNYKNNIAAYLKIPTRSTFPRNLKLLKYFWCDVGLKLKIFKKECFKFLSVFNCLKWFLSNIIPSARRVFC